MRHLASPWLWAPAYVLLCFGLGFLPLIPTDFDIFFWPSVHTILSGHPFSVYATYLNAPYPNANGPLALFPLAAVGLVLQALGHASDPRWVHPASQALFSVFLLLAAREAVLAIETIRARPLAPAARLVAAAAILLPPPVWQSFVEYGHLEQSIEAWLLLWSARLALVAAPGRSGLALGLAAVSRSTAIFQAPPLALAAWRRSPRASAWLLFSAFLTALVCLLPFFAASPQATWHSLVAFRSDLAIGHGSIWALAWGTQAGAAFLKHIDLVVGAVFVLAASFALLRPGAKPSPQRVYAALLLSSLCFAAFAKTVWPYYFFEPYVLACVWAFGRWRPGESRWRLAWPPLAVIALGLLAEIGATPDPYLALVQIHLQGAGQFAAIASLAAWVIIVARQPEPSPAAAHPSGL